VKQLLFFATKNDLQPLLKAVERQTLINYVRMGNALTNETERYENGEAIPNLGSATKDSASACDEYLVVLKDQPVKVRTLRGSDDALRYLVDQLSNPGTVTFAPGGIWSDDVILHGRVATVYDDKNSQTLMETFSKEIRRSFRKVKAYWIGPQAEALLDAGKRLTISSHASPEFDLIKAG
jgi:hypothetical protein